MTHPFLSLSPVMEAVTGRKGSLLEADLVKNGAELRARIAGARVLVIGGAGTIGASFIRAMLRQGMPDALVVFDINENGLTELTRDLRSGAVPAVPADFRTYPVNFGDAVFEKLLRKEGPFDIVANFAAHKHVRSEKDLYSIEAMIDNNVFKAQRLLALLREFPPKHFFCVSTDKAANPANIMGASKKIMEDLLMGHRAYFPVATARFANVLFSNGSLPQGFLERLSRRQPLSAPADIRRFFVTPEESGEICLLAALLGQSGEIFFPKLDADSHLQTFTRIAESLLEQLGLRPGYCTTEQEAREKAAAWEPGNPQYPVYFFHSDTSGEKPYEEFYTGNETLDMHRFEALGVICDTPTPALEDLEIRLDALREAFRHPDFDKTKLVDRLQAMVPGLQHVETGKSLDKRM